MLSTLYNQTGDIRLVAKVGGHSVATASKYYVDVDEERLRNT
ncbi:MAG: integrase, partial [Tissierellia bacterium]|nr:integrase [Tissierellia bacterium]